MRIIAETDRLFLREIDIADEKSFFLLDSDPEVHTFLGSKPVETAKEARMMIESIKRQYVEKGIGRWAVVEKATGNFVGWSGLKLITEMVNTRIDYYELGYRFLKKYWGRGYATEAAEASLCYAFQILKLKQIFAIADINNLASRSVLEKVEFEIVETFFYQYHEHHWFEIDKEKWSKKG